MDCSTPGLPVHHQLLEFAHTHVHWIGDAIQPSHPLSSPSPPALNLSQSGSFQMSQLFILGGQSIGVSASASVLPMNIQDWSPLGWTGWISLQSKGLSRVFSSITVRKHQFLSAQPPLWSSSPFHMWVLDQPCVSVSPLPLGSPSSFLSHPVCPPRAPRLAACVCGSFPLALTYMG